MVAEVDGRDGIRQRTQALKLEYAMRSRQAGLDTRQAFGTQSFPDDDERGHASNKHRALKSRSPGKALEREVLKTPY
jgi:hypothetical protein